MSTKTQSMYTTLAQADSTRPVARTIDELAAWRGIDAGILRANCKRNATDDGWELGQWDAMQRMPDVPRPDKKTGKLAKYLCLPGENKFGLFIPKRSMLGKDFLSSIDHQGIAYITEGHFKSMKCCEQGILCLAVPGIWNFQYTDDDGSKYLMPSISRLKDRGIHTIVITYDADCLTNPDIHKSSIIFAEMAITEGLGVKIATGTWNPEDGKGMDDAISKNGVEWMRARLEQALTLEEYKDKYHEVINAPKAKKGERERKEEGGKLARQYDAFKAFYGSRLRFNELELDIEMDGKSFDVEDARIQISQDLAIDLSIADATQFFKKLSLENKYDPFIDFLDQCGVSFRPAREAKDLLPHDVAVLEAVLMKKLGDILRVDDKLSLLFVVKTIVAAVRRSREPGCNHRTVLMFHGQQNIGKSTFWRLLAGDEFFADDYQGTCDQADIMRLHSRRIHEISEIDAVFSKQDAAQLKANISRTTDMVKLPYARKITKHPRKQIIVATTNAYNPLRDPTGDTRFWTVHLHQKVDLEMLKRERTAIWAIADILYGHGYSTELDDSQQTLSTENNKSYRDVEQIDDALETWLQRGNFGGGWRTPIMLQEALDHIYPDVAGKMISRAEQRRVTEALRRIGYEPTRQRLNGKVTAVWAKTESVTALPVQLHHSNSSVTSAIQGFEPTVTAVTPPNQTFLKNKNEESSNLLLQPVTAIPEEVGVKCSNTVTDVQNPLTATVTVALPHCYSTESAVTAVVKQNAIAIEDPHNDNYEPRVGDEVIITSPVVASSIGERHTIARVLGNKGIHIKTVQKTTAGKKEEKVVTLSRDQYSPATKQPAT